MSESSKILNEFENDINVEGEGEQGMNSNRNEKKIEIENIDDIDDNNRNRKGENKNENIESNNPNNIFALGNVKKINNRNLLIQKLRNEDLNLKNRISKKKLRRRRMRKNLNIIDLRGAKDEKKMRKLNKLHENDLSGISLGDSVVLKEEGNYMIKDKKLIKKIELSQKEHEKNLKEEKSKSKKRENLKINIKVKQKIMKR